MSEKLIRITKFNISLNSILGTSFTDFYVYRSKGLMTHLLNRNHYISAKYIDNLAEIIEQPDYAGYNNRTIELVKEYKNNIFVCIKLDEKRNKHYVSTMFDIKSAKIESYVSSGRLIRIKQSDHT